MSDEIIRSKLIRAQQSLIQSSQNYDAGCMLLKEALNMMPNPYKQKNQLNDKVAELIGEVNASYVRDKFNGKGDGSQPLVCLADVIEIIERVMQ